MAVGDLQLAARILWAGLKAIWYTGVAELNKVWPTLQAAASAVWQQISQLAGAAATYIAGVWSQLPQWLAAQSPKGWPLRQWQPGAVRKARGRELNSWQMSK